ncbi:putative S-adenosyl-L-methionine-dependent methyltransferase [Planctomycetes bacterium Pan216]|uniref:Putative S-adenosyl-L-methionine-dependent methyltransferase n=1 Tax=Kolteria novifilia TaxID=2527975 RepID=A0A518BC79_9BACT|nr:putative S-adenosyl-L-methionine-dependent methyltransferase [Planctomycetes bacterium Pan216]
MSEEKKSTYDEIPYEIGSYPATQPSSIGVVAQFFGLKPAPADKCRVLELGCGSGWNLIPMACRFPESEYVGIDLSKTHIDDAEAATKELGLGERLKFHHGSITDVDESFGTFDYILCHGVYSWVPREVQDHIMKICHDNLRPDGVAYISYNTYPGWHMRGMIRDMMRYHAQEFAEPLQKVREARGLIDFLSQTVSAEGNAYGMMLQNELKLLKRTADSYQFHEHLEEVNDPIYFYQFIERAQGEKLKYLSEASVSSMLVNNMPEKVELTLRRVSNDEIRIEQYMDFVRNRTFRQTLLCHESQKVHRHLNAGLLNEFCIAFGGQPATDASDAALETKVDFNLPGGRKLTCGDATLIRLLRHLGERWPNYEPTGDALSAVGVTPNTKVAEQVLASLLKLYTSDALVARTIPPTFTTEVAERPVAPPMVRFQAARSKRIVNALHETHSLNDFFVLLLKELDGSKDKEALSKIMVDAVKGRKLSLAQEGVPLRPDDPKVAEIIPNAVDEVLRKLARAGFLADGGDVK